MLPICLATWKTAPPACEVHFQRGEEFFRYARFLHHAERRKQEREAFHGFATSGGSFKI